jgi:hypothetical protein
MEDIIKGPSSPNNTRDVDDDIQGRSVATTGNKEVVEVVGTIITAAARELTGLRHHNEKIGIPDIETGGRGLSIASKGTPMVQDDMLLRRPVTTTAAEAVVAVVVEAMLESTNVVGEENLPGLEVQPETTTDPTSPILDAYLAPERRHTVCEVVDAVVLPGDSDSRLSDRQKRTLLSVGFFLVVLAAVIVVPLLLRHNKHGNRYATVFNDRLQPCPQQVALVTYCERLYRTLIHPPWSRT